MDYIWFLFRFEGRINRAKCWLATLLIPCCMIFSLILLSHLADLLGIANGPFSINLGDISASIETPEGIPAAHASWFPQVVNIAMTCVFAWPYAAISIKRLHDRNKSGWWIIPFIVATGLYSEFGDRLAGFRGKPFVGFAAFVLVIWGLVEMYFLRGTRGPNRFGPDPVAPVTPAAPRDTRPGWDQHSELEFVPHSAGPSAGPHVNREP
jgi:uncharacterized membrane protein YhaH (DUF805 family)